MDLASSAGSFLFLADVFVLIVLVHLGCYKKIPETEWFINNRHLFLKVLDAGKSKIKVPADSVSGESPLSGP